MEVLTVQSYDQIMQLWGVYAYAFQTQLLCIVFLIFDPL